MSPPYIFTLPNELLLIVFELLVELDPLGEIVCDDDDDTSDTTSSFASDVDDTYSYVSQSSLFSGYSLGFMNITHVCHSWRELALNLPTLWTTVPLGLCSDWVDVLVQRSGGMLLDIRIPFDVDKDSVNNSLIRIGTERIRRIYSENNTFDALWILNSRARFPFLEEIDSDYDSQLFLLIEKCCALRKLTLSISPGTVFLPNSSQARGISKHLTELTLRTAMTTVIAFVDPWANIISNLTLLHLELVYFIFSPHDEQFAIELPRLQKLSIVETGSHCGTFLCRFSIPSSAVCNQQFMGPTVTLQKDALIEDLPYFEAIKSAFEPRPLSLLAISHRTVPRSVNSVHGWRRAPDFKEGAPYFNIENERVLPHGADVVQTVESHYEHIFEGFTPAFLCQPYFGTLDMLALDLDERFKYIIEPRWRDALGSMPQLRHLRISSPWVGIKTPLNILKALLCLEPGDDAVVPLLNTLTLVDWKPDVDEQGQHTNIGEHDEALHLRGSPGGVVRAIVEDRIGVLHTVYLKSWRGNYNAKWRIWLKGLHGVAVVYEDQFMPLDYVHATEEDQGYDIEEDGGSEEDLVNDP